MTRGKQKIEAQKKAQERQAAQNKGGSQMDARQAALKTTCPVCKTQLTNEGQLKQHMEAKHPNHQT